MSEPTADQMHEWQNWLLSRPDVVREVAEALPPWREYRLPSTGQRAQPLAYAEDGTIRALCWQEWCPALTAVEVFGLLPTDFADLSSQEIR